MSLFSISSMSCCMAKRCVTAPNATRRNLNTLAVLQKHQQTALIAASPTGRRSAARFVALHRYFSSESSSTNTVENCAKSLSRASQQIVADEQAASELALRLSPAARNEILNSIETLSSQKQIPQPSRHDLRLVALNQAIPFVGFGIMDNAILIIAGDAIDASLGVLLGISTLCAAAIGNIISDVAGVMLGTVIEDACAMLGLPTPNVSAAQRQLRSVRFASQFGCALGIIVGCVIGMFPLIWIDANKSQRLKQASHMEQIFKDVVTEAKGLIGAEVTSLFLVVDSPTSTTLTSGKGQYLYAKYVGGKTFSDEQPIRGLLGRGIISRAALTGQAVNIYDARTEPDFEGDGFWKPMLDHEVKNMLCVPVFDATGSVIAVIQAINKVERGMVDSDVAGDIPLKSGFTAADEQVLKALATHISVALQNMKEEENELGLRDTIRMLKDHGLAAISEEDASKGGPRKRRPLFED